MGDKDRKIATYSDNFFAFVCRAKTNAYFCSPFFEKHARVAELVDALDSKSSDSNIVPVRPRPRVLRSLARCSGAFFVSKTQVELVSNSRKG